MEEIIQFDKQLLLMVNGSDSVFLDYVMMTLTNARTWIPLYLSLLYVVIKTNRQWREVLLILAAAGLCVLLAGTVDDTIVKPLAARWRPTHDPQIGSLVDVVDGYRGGSYGFFSAHASNTFSIALFFSLLMRQRVLVVSLVLWSLVNCWTRLYLGVHYPGDILVGLFWGGFVGVMVWLLHQQVSRQWSTGRGFVSEQYTSTGYQQVDADVVISVLIFTLLYAVLHACFFLYV
jgi:undecaprenyl-diphosphatase